MKTDTYEIKNNMLNNIKDLKIINVVTLGYGKRIATWVAKKLGYDDCGCNDRKNDLDKKVKLW